MNDTLEDRAIAAAAPPPTRRAAWVGSARFRRRSYGSNHPLAIPRSSLALDLVHAYRAMTRDEFVEARRAADFELEWFHTRDYVAAIRTAEALGRVKQEHRDLYRLGTLENPFFPELFSTPALAAGASIQGAKAVLDGRVAFAPAGGMHHARPGRAQGFCFFNDAVLGVMRLRRAGLRVLYVDLDAHHGDAVEAAFLADPEVMTLSLHMDTAYAYPHAGGRLEDVGLPQAGYTTMNLPLPQAVNDTEYRLVVEAVWDDVLARFRPDAIVLQAGTDAIAQDPLGKLGLSTQGFLAAATRVIDSAPCHAGGAPRLLATGGGGYHPLVLARAWTGLWAVLSGRTLPEAIPDVGAAALRAAGWDQDEDEPYFERLFRTRLDEPNEGPVRDAVRLLAERARAHPFFRT